MEVTQEVNYAIDVKIYWRGLYIITIKGVETEIVEEEVDNIEFMGNLYTDKEFKEKYGPILYKELIEVEIPDPLYWEPIET